MDFDADDTMVSQQTAATEVSQPVQSRARQVSECVCGGSLALADNF